MQIHRFKEEKKHGSFEFPAQLYQVDKHHPQYQMPVHWHTEWEIVLVKQGSITVTLNSFEYTLKAGQAMMINGGDLHAGIAENCQYSCLVFNLRMLQGAGHHFIEKLKNHEAELNPVLRMENPVVRQIVHLLFACLEEEKTGHQLIFCGLLYQLLGHLMNLCEYTEIAGGRPAVHPRVRQLKRALRLVENGYDQPLTLGQLAEAAGMSPKYFCRFFAQMTQQTPMEYVNWFRVEKACHLLGSRSATITEVAYSCGFNDASYFIRVFKKLKNCTPGQYAAIAKY